MRTAFLTLGFCLLSNSVGAEALPSSGACEWETNSLPSEMRITWSGEKAEISLSGRKYTTTVVGMRPHGDFFRFSLVYIDEIFGITEIALFAHQIAGDTKYRMGFVTYNETSDGERVIESMSGFSDAICVVM